MQPEITTTSDQVQLRKDKLIGVGIYAHVYRLDEKSVRKLPAPNSDDSNLAIRSVRNEGQIYAHLGDHPRVIKLLNRGDQFVDLEYASHGHIESYLKTNHDISNECRIRFAQEVIEAVSFVHSKGIVHSDLAARQFLLDSKLDVKLSDFGFSSLGDGEVFGFENPSHHLPRNLDVDKPNTTQSDVFALGSTLYEIMAGERPYEGMSDDDITTLYKRKKYPDVKSILCGDVILGCWKGHFKSAEEVLKCFLELHLSEHSLTQFQFRQPEPE